MPHRPGLVRRVAGGVYDVELEDGRVVPAVLRGRLKLEARTGDRVVVGDRVEVAIREDGGATIETVHERRNELARRAPGRGARRAKVIVANLDRMIVVLAAARPEPRLRMLDRFLVIAEANGLDAAVVVNKIDLADEAEVRDRFAPYVAAGYPLLLTSVPAGRGIAELESLLCGRTSVLAGPSGVGKSSLLNAIDPALQLRTGEIGEAAGKGRHTTVTADLIPLRCGGYVADTPGLRELGLWGIDADSLDLYFPEIAGYREDCRFGGSCSHVHEPGCAVRAAVERGEIPVERYESYRALRTGEDAGV